MVYLINWLLFVIYYIFIIIFPNCLNDMDEKSLEKELIDQRSKLYFLYFRKKTYPKLKSIAITTIILFLMNTIFTIVWLIISNCIDDNIVIKVIEACYILLFVLVGTVPIIKLNIHKNNQK